QPHGVVHHRGGDTGAVGAEAHFARTADSALEDGELLSGFGVPQPRRLVLAPRGDAAAVRAEDNRKNWAGVPFEDGERLSGFGVPQPRRPILAGGGDAPAVGAETHGINRARVPLEDRDLRVDYPVEEVPLPRAPPWRQFLLQVAGLPQQLPRTLRLAGVPLTLG